MRAHVNEQEKFGGQVFEFRAGRIDACNYCGSMTPATLLDMFKRGAVARFGDCAVYGWPYQLFVNMPGNALIHKFRMEHLMDAASEDLDELCELILTATGVAFTVTDDTLVWQKVSTSETQN